MGLSVSRLDNNLWGYTPEAPSSELQEALTQIQITTPTWTEPALSYSLAQMVAKVLKDQNIHTEKQLENDFTLSVTNNAPPLIGKWKVSLVRHDHWSDAFFDFFPFTQAIRDKQIAVIEISQETDSLFTDISNLFFQTTQKQSFLIDQCIDPLVAELPVDKVLSAPLFDDAFTNLAALYLRTNSPFFVSEETVKAAYYFVFNERGALQIKEIPSRPFTDEEKEQNRKVSQFYKQFIIKQFGEERLKYISCAYGFSLDTIITEGSGLVPDHIFKINIGMNNIELSDVQHLYRKLVHLKNQLEQDNPVEIESILPLRESRKLTSSFSKTDLLPFLQKYIKDDHSLVQNLPPEVFNLLVDWIMPSDEERERAFTGRKITHLAIRGALTQNGPDEFNASRDLFEMLHLYPQFRNPENWENYLELVSHTLIKKNLFRKTIPLDGQTHDEWHVGFLFPGPSSAEGEKRWYYNEAFSDDNLGNVNYVLLPACSGYQSNGSALPMIKAYRSTASTQNQVNYLESFVADMNPYGSPNSIDPESAFAYEKKYFDERTIPAWVGYLLLGDQLNDSTMYHKALEEYRLCIQCPGNPPPAALLSVCKLCETRNHIDIREFLFKEATLHKELPEFKIAQDIAFTGHSLGASLAQFGIYYFGPRRNRIPLPTCNFYCYSSRGPGIDTYQDAAFMNFGRQYKDLISGLNQKKWVVRQQLEYGDFVPEGGQSHLGTTGYDVALDADWIEPDFTIFKPLETAKDLAITTISAHGRRTGNALEGCDFSLKRLSVQELYDFDHSWWMTAETINTFGFRIFRSTKIAELVREVVSVIAYPIWKLAILAHNFFWPPIGVRDNANVWFLNYTDK